MPAPLSWESPPCVILPASYELPGLTDSKKLSARQREALYAAITAQAVAWSALRLLKINRFSLPNLLAGADIVPECMQEDCNPPRLAAELAPLLTNAPAADAQRAALAAVAAQLPANVSARAADAITAQFRL